MTSPPRPSPMPAQRDSDHHAVAPALPPDAAVWMPPRLLAKYQRSKILGGILFTAIFLGWLWLQWSNPWMRLLAGALVVLTAWVTTVSVRHDQRRARGRQLAVDHQNLYLLTPQGLQVVKLADIHHARWRDDEQVELGLHLFDNQNRRIALVDEMFVAEEAEARSLLAWLRQQTARSYDVAWPNRTGP